MQNLSKIQINSRYENQYEANSYLLSYGFGPVWDYDRQQEIAICYVLYSTNDYLCNTNQKILNSFKNITGLANIADVQFIGNIDLQYNTPSYVSTSLNGNLRTITQETTIVQGTVTYNYTFTTSYNISTGVFTSTNLSSYSDSSTGIETETVVTPNPDGTTTSTTTTTSNDGTEIVSEQNYNENGNITSSYTTTSESNGTETVSEQHYNDDGNLTSSATSYDYSGTSGGTSPDGWETVTYTVNYDDDGNPSDGENQWVDPSGNENTQTIEYDDNGDEYITGYEIDTTNNQNGGETLTNPIDTGVMAFDGRDFDIHLKAKFNWSNLQYNSGTTQRINPILNLSGNDINNKVNGFLILWLTNMSGSNYYDFNGSQLTSQYCTVMRVNKYLNDVANFVYNVQYPPGNNKSTGSLGLPKNSTGTQILVFEIQSRSNVFTIEVYNASGTKIGILTRQKSSPYTHEDIDFGSSTFADVTVELGHWDSVNDGVQYSFVYEVLEFNVTKLPETP